MKYILALSFIFLSTSVCAQRFWTNTLTDWRLSLNNGEAYVHSSAFPPECKYNRARLIFDGKDYTNALWSYLLVASKTGESIQVVLDHERSAPEDSVTCRIYSAEVVR